MTARRKRTTVLRLTRMPLPKMSVPRVWDQGFALRARLNSNKSGQKIVNGMSKIVSECQSKGGIQLTPPRAIKARRSLKPSR
jgi:hypothetical protein